MSTQGNGTDITRIAGADLSAAQYLAVKLDSNAAVVLAGAGEDAIGILQNKPASGQAATVRIAGLTKWKAGGVVAAGIRVAVAAGGKVKAAVAAATNTSDAGGATDPLIGSFSMGHSFEAATADGHIIEVMLAKSGAIPTTAA